MKYLKKIFIVILLSTVFLFNVSLKSFAQEDEISKNFNIDASVRYLVGESGNTQVSQTITITNKSEFIYIPSYSLIVSSKGISNIKVSNSSGSLIHSEDEKNGRKTISVTFPEKIVGVGKKNTFTIFYNSSSIANKTGKVWRVYIPSVSKNNIFSSYNVIVDVPDSFGNPTIIKPNISTTPNSSRFNFTSAQLGDSGISMIFGENQIYSFNLRYNLENKNLVPVKTEIALLPNTAYQKVNIQSIVPMPENVYKDNDGNILATYVLPGKTKLTVNAKVSVTAYATPQKTEDLKNPQIYLTPHSYWEVNNYEIQKLAKIYNTPEKIYNFVVNTLSYSHEKAGNNNKRLGALGSLKNPEFAVCLEFTDLFITLARAAGIPARAVEGYAYTSDEIEQPVSLFEDILHSWPEYYDFNKKQWIMVDPTWGNTTFGVDYFNTFDFDHVAFAINGLNSEYPVPAGGYKTSDKSKDIDVAFIDSVPYTPQSYDLKVQFPYVSFSKNPQGKVIIENKTGTEIDKAIASVMVNGKKNLDLSFEGVPPFGKKELKVTLYNENLFSVPNFVYKLEVVGSGKTFYKRDIIVVPLSYWYLIGGGILIGTVTILTIAIKTGGLSFQKQGKRDNLHRESKRP